MVSERTQRYMSSTVPSFCFRTVEIDYYTSQKSSQVFSGRAMASSASFWLHLCNMQHIESAKQKRYFKKSAKYKWFSTCSTSAVSIKDVQQKGQIFEVICNEEPWQRLIKMQFDASDKYRSFLQCSSVAMPNKSLSSTKVPNIWVFRNAAHRQCQIKEAFQLQPQIQQVFNMQHMGSSKWKKYFSASAKYKMFSTCKPGMDMWGPDFSYSMCPNFPDSRDPMIIFWF